MSYIYHCNILSFHFYGLGDFSFRISFIHVVTSSNGAVCPHGVFGSLHDSQNTLPLFFCTGLVIILYNEDGLYSPKFQGIFVKIRPLIIYI
jgi:hypothetical protein